MAPNNTCPGCGANTADSARYCANCGVSLQRDPAQRLPELTAAAGTATDDPSPRAERSEARPSAATTPSAKTAKPPAPRRGGARVALVVVCVALGALSGAPAVDEDSLALAL